MIRRPWCRVRINALPREEFGQITQAWHRRGRPTILLVLHRPCSRNGAWGTRIGVWCLVHDGVLIRRRAAYGRRPRSAPWRWANQTLRQHAGDANGQACFTLDGTRPTLAESIAARPPTFDELPPVLARHDRHRDRPLHLAPMAGDPEVPAEIPLLPPLRCTRRRAVLTKEEWTLYVETWRGWAADHPVAVLDGTKALNTLCLETVLSYRITLLSDLGRYAPMARPLHAAFLRRERAKAAVLALSRSFWG